MIPNRTLQDAAEGARQLNLNFISSAACSKPGIRCGAGAATDWGLIYFELFFNRRPAPRLLAGYYHCRLYELLAHLSIQEVDFRGGDVASPGACTIHPFVRRSYSIVHRTTASIRLYVRSRPPIGRVVPYTVRPAITDRTTLGSPATGRKNRKKERECISIN